MFVRPRTDFCCISGAGFFGHHIRVQGIARRPACVINDIYLDFLTAEGAIDHYRILILDQAGEVAGFSMCNAATDAAALSLASRWLGKQRDVEVWRGPQLVGTVSIAPSSTTEAAPAG